MICYFIMRSKLFGKRESVNDAIFALCDVVGNEAQFVLECPGLI